jgi:hypothetical protein
MTASTEPTATLSDLYRADGSATFSQNGYTVVGSVNGPIEVQRRDELPEEAAVDVVVRPAAGVGGLLACTHVHTPKLTTSRYPGAASRVDYPVNLTSNYPHPQLSTDIDPSRIADHKYTGR